MKSSIESNIVKTLIFFFYFFLLNVNAQIVSTVAGSTQGFANGTGNTAQFNQPFGVAVALDGTIYVADTYNNVIRKITTDGTVTTFAGSVGGFVDGVGNNAQFNYPQGIAVDASGNVFVADTGNHAIRKISVSGVVTTFAGGSTILGFADGIGTEAKFYLPSSLVIDSEGNIFVSDTGNFRIRKITAARVVTTIAGNSNYGYADGIGSDAQFISPNGIALNSEGSLFVADSQNQRIRKITLSGVVTTIAGSTQGFSDGLGDAAQFDYPFGIVVDDMDNLYVTDIYNHRVRKITTSNVVSTFAGSTQGFTDDIGTAAQFDSPFGIAAASDGNLIVADSFNNRIRKITATLATPVWQKENPIVTYPNPCKSLINIDIENFISADLSLCDINGRPLLKQRLNDNKTELNLSDLANGIYVLQITTDKASFLRKIVKN